MDYAAEEVCQFLAPIPRRELPRDVAEDLDLPCSTAEIVSAMLSMNSNKTPDLDGYPAEWYGTYKEFMASKLLEVYSDALERGVLPDSLREALIVLIPKPHKDNDYCELYRPISLLWMPKVLAKRLNKVIVSIIHSDQMGFIPMRSTAINLRGLFTVLQSEGPDTDTRVVVSLDTHKAFDSIEWPYLWAVLERFRLRYSN